MQTIDLNADIGEAATADGQAAERAILKLVSSANIACGGHAGDDKTMRATARAAKENGVSIGAHPGYPDPHHFGRKSMGAWNAALGDMLKASLTEQIIRLSEVCADEGACVAYVKPHGALYNDAVKDADYAALIASVIKDIDPALMFLGAPKSCMGEAAEKCGLKFVTEGFIDRRYTDDGHLQPRGQKGAVIEDQTERLAQARALASSGQVTTASGNPLVIKAQSLCLHGDSAGAVETARQARVGIESAGLKIKAFAP